MKREREKEKVEEDAEKKEKRSRGPRFFPSSISFRIDVHYVLWPSPFVLASFLPVMPPLPPILSKYFTVGSFSFRSLLYFFSFFTFSSSFLLCTFLRAEKTFRNRRRRAQRSYPHYYAFLLPNKGNGENIFLPFFISTTYTQPCLFSHRKL